VQRVLLTVFIGAMMPFHASAQPLTIVAPAAPGGGWDQTARVMQQTLAHLDPETAVQVENIPGAAGTIGLARFVSAERGSPHALLVTGLVMVSAIVMNHAPVTLNETTPIARLTGEYEVIVVPADSKWQTLGELIAQFKTAPATVAWGGGSAGGTDDLLVRLIASEVGVAPGDANYIAFPGGGAALAALLGGQVTAGVSGYGEFAGQITAGTLRLLAVSAPSRLAGIDAPTLRERGIALDLANWRGVVAPPGLTELERQSLTARVERMAASAEWKAVLDRNGWSDVLLTGAPFRQFLLAEQQRIEQMSRSLASASATATPTAVAGRLLRLTPRTLPLFAVVGMIVLTAFVVLRAPAKAGGFAAALSAVGTRPLILIAVLFLHAIAMPVIGFIPASAALFTLAARMMGSRRIVFDATVGIAGATALFLVFTRGLGLAL
jgi:putative tricarboxylic transport membrane protein